MVDSHLRNRAGQESPFAAPARFAINLGINPLGISTAEVGENIAAWLRRIEQKENRLLGVQDDINEAAAVLTGATNTITAVAADLTDAASNISAEIAAFQQANPGVDTSALIAACDGLTAPLSQLSAAQAAVDALKTPVAAPAGQQGVSGAFTPAAAPVAEQAAPADTSVSTDTAALAADVSAPVDTATAAPADTEAPF